MSLKARVRRKYTDVPGKAHLFVHPSTGFWSEMVRLGTKLIALHTDVQGGEVWLGNSSSTHFALRG